MHARRIIRSVIASGLVGLGFVCIQGGCGDDSRTTGSQLRISPEVKAEMDDMRAAQKDVRAERKQEKAAGKVKKK